MRLTDEELESLLAGGESDRVELKDSLSGEAKTKIREAICAFANDLPNHRQPGVVFVGVRDDGSPSGLRVDDALLLTLADMKTDGSILPQPTLSVERRTVAGADVAVLTVVPADAPPVYYKQRICVRIGPRRGFATKQDERMLNERRRSRDLPFDLQSVPGSTLADLSRLYFEQEYLPAIVAPEVLAANERSFEERLASTRMIAGVDDPTPTVLGHLVAGIRPRDFLPGGYVQVLRLEGTDLAAPIVDEQAIDGRIADVIRLAEDKLKLYNTMSVNLTSADLEQRTPAYPLVALQQLFRNAMLHRTYEGTNAPVRVYWFSDRVEIHSPGGPYGIVTENNFGQPGITDYRNPHLAEALKALGFLQRFGVGIQTAREALKSLGRPPLEFIVAPTAVTVTLRMGR